MAKQLAILQNPLLVYSGLQRMLCAILLPPVPEVEDLSSALHCLILSWDDTQRMSLGSHLCELGFLQLVV